MKNKKLLIPIAYIALIALCVFIIYIIPSVAGMMVKTYIVEQGEVSLKEEVKAYVIRDELVYKAAHATGIKRLAEKNRLVKAGTQIVELSGPGMEESEDKKDKEDKYAKLIEKLGDAAVATENGVTGFAGRVAYYADGYEGTLTPARLDEIKQSEFKKIDLNLMKATAKGKCFANDPVFKIVKNTKWYMVFYVDKKDTDKYIEGYDVDVKIGDETYGAEIWSVDKGRKVTRVVVKCGFFHKTFATDRVVDATVTTINASGLKLESSSVIEKDGKKGVLVKNKMGNFVFTPVRIKADDGTNCVAYQDIYTDENGNFVETIGIYDEVVSKPTQKEIKEAE